LFNYFMLCTFQFVRLSSSDNFNNFLTSDETSIDGAARVFILLLRTCAGTKHLD